MRGALRLVRFRGAAGGGPRLGLEEAPGGDLVDLSAAEPELPRSMREFLEIGPRGLELAHRALQSGQHRVPRAAAQLLAPLGDPQKVICVGLNYHDHCQEQAVKVPKEPLIFSKFPSAITGPFDDIVHPQDTSELDWEVELAAVIGKRGRHIEVPLPGPGARCSVPRGLSPGARCSVPPGLGAVSPGGSVQCPPGLGAVSPSRPRCPQEAAALQHVLGFTVANDVSARDWQMRRNGRQWLLGKTFDTFCPLGPAIVTREAVPGATGMGHGRCHTEGMAALPQLPLLPSRPPCFPHRGVTVALSPCPPRVTSHRRAQPVDPLQRQRAAHAGQQHPPPHLRGARPRRLGVPVGRGAWGPPRPGGRG
uniref:Fumarylacetoacetate hydrolase domain containing 2A n=1 Tax=Taeniopygia guttata TaxID=59729 RepID=A0A674GVF8_TAEGU